MNKIKITLRQKEILKKICNEYKYVTVSSIAEKLDISSRTVLRELGDIEGWLEVYGCGLDKRTGMGIRLKGSLEDRKRILDSLEEGKEIKNYTAKERQVIILGELLQEKEPVKLFSFTKSLNVTEGTVSHDLDKVENWLKGYDLKLIRKPGLGIYIEGPEEEIRKAIVNLIYENIDEIQLLNLVRDNLSVEVATRERLLNLIEKDTIRKIEALIFELEEALGYRLADNAYIGLLVHLALAIQRIRKGDKISMDKAYLSELRNYSEFKTAADLTRNISKAFSIEIPEDEIGYITMHLRGSKGFKNEKLNRESEALAKEMIRIAEVETGSFLEHNEQSITGLISHLGPAINRLRMKMDIRNPLLNEIKEHYSELFKLAAKCSAPIEKHLGIKMPESEIAYIAMHLGAALEKKDSERRVYKAVVACTTGIGTSRLLAARIEREYDNIEIVEVISSIHIKESTLANKGVDFVVSTVPIDAVEIPVVVVNPLFFIRDKELVDNLVKQLKNRPLRNSKEKKSSADLKEKLAKLNLYTEGIIQILDNFFLYSYDGFNTINEAIKEISFRLTDECENAELIERDLNAREEKGSTVLTGLNTVLLHCKTSGVLQLHFGAVQIKGSLYAVNADGEEEQIRLAMIMLAPENCEKEHIEVISFVSTKLIEEPEFLRDLTEGQEKDAFSKLNNFLDEFYRTKTN